MALQALASTNFTTALSGFSLGTNIVSSFLGASAEKEAGKAKQQIANFNARIDERNAEETIQNSEFQAGLVENQAISDKQFTQFQIDLAKAETSAELIDSAFRVHKTRLLNRRSLATQRSKISGSGIAISGSALEIMSETAGLLEMGVLEIQRESRLKRQGLELDIGLLERQKIAKGQATDTEVKLIRRAGKIQSRNLLESAAITRAGGEISRKAGDINSRTALLTGATRFTRDFISFKEAGIN